MQRRYFPGREINWLWFKFDANETYTFVTNGPSTCVASFLLSGSRCDVISHDTGDDFQHGTWHCDNPTRLYVDRYHDGDHTIEAGPNGLEYLCALANSKRPPKIDCAEVCGDYTVPAGVSLFVASGSITDETGDIAQFGERPAFDHETVITGEADVLLMIPPP